MLKIIRNINISNSYVRSNSKTSGASFYRELSQYLNKKKLIGKSILLNIDAEIHIFILCIFLKRKITLRIDGLYSDTYSAQNFYTLNKFKKIVFLFLRLFFNKNRSFFIATNLSEIFKIYLSESLIFQSFFVKDQIRYHLQFVKRKRYNIIHNCKDMAVYKYQSNINSSPKILKIMTLFDPLRSRKRTDLMLLVLEGIIKNFDMPIQVNMFGFYKLKKYPTWFLKNSIKILEQEPNWLNLFPRFINSSESQDFYKLSINDLTFTLSIFDPCPNFIVESLCLGIPVIGPNIGGISELVQKGGILVKEPINLEDKYFYDDLYRMRQYNQNDIDNLILVYSKSLRQIYNNLDIYKRFASLQYGEKLTMSRCVDLYSKHLFFIQKDNL